VFYELILAVAAILAVPGHVLFLVKRAAPCVPWAGARNISEFFSTGRYLRTRCITKFLREDLCAANGEISWVEMEKGGFKMFNLVSSWNKRRRSRSLDQLNPCERTISPSFYPPSIYARISKQYALQELFQLTRRCLHEIFF